MKIYTIINDYYIIAGTIIDYNNNKTNNKSFTVCTPIHGIVYFFA